MSTDVSGLVRALGRELVVAVLTWIGALTALFGVAVSLIPTYRAMAQRGGMPFEQMREYLPVSDGPLLAQWTEFVTGYATFDYGLSAVYNEPVVALFGPALGRSMTVMFAFVVVAAILTVAALWVTTRVSPVTRGRLTVPAYVLGLLAPIVGGVLVLWFAYATDSLGTILTPPPEADGGTVNAGLLLVVATVVALPIVGDAVRRAHRLEDADNTLTLGSLFGPGTGPFGTVEVWGYVLYLTSSLVVLERLFQYQGLGWYSLDAIQENDFSLLLGMAAGLVLVLVVFSFLRNVAWVVARYLRSQKGAAQARTREQPTAGTTGDAAGTGEGARQHGDLGGSLWSAVSGNRRLQVGVGLLGTAVFLGIAGAVAVSIETAALQRPPVPGLAGGIFLNTLASFVTGLVVALLVAVVLGLLPGLLAGVLEGYEIGPGTVLPTILRIPSEVAMVVPVAFASLLYVAAFPPGAGIGGELAIGTVTGLVLAGFTYRAVHETASTRIAEAGPEEGWLGESLVAALARLDFVAVVTVFVAGELVYLGTVPFGPYYAFTQMNIAINGFGALFAPGGNVGGTILTAVLAMASFVLGFALIGDGLGKIAARLRESGAPASPLHPQQPTSPQPGGTRQSPPQSPQSQPARGQGQSPQGQGRPPQGQSPQNQGPNHSSGADGVERDPLK